MDFRKLTILSLICKNIHDTLDGILQSETENWKKETFRWNVSVLVIRLMFIN
jgi:hypothetical protein